MNLPSEAKEGCYRVYLAVDSSLAAKQREVSINMDRIWLHYLTRGIVEYRRVGAGGWKKHYRTIGGKGYDKTHLRIL